MDQNGQNVVRNVFSFLIFGGPFTRLRRGVLAQEASFRFALVRAPRSFARGSETSEVREHAEPVAFFDGHGFELRRCHLTAVAKLPGPILKCVGPLLLDSCANKTQTPMWQCIARPKALACHSQLVTSEVTRSSRS